MNWSYFNGSGIRPATSTNQVVIGGTSTSTLMNPFAKLGVFGGASFDNATSSAFFSSTILGSVAKFGATASSSFAADGALTLAGSLNGPLQANNGLVSATTSIGVLYGGTGSTTLTGILKGNGLGQVQTAIAGTDYSNFAFPFTPTDNFGLLTSATSSTLLLTNGLHASSTVRFGNAGGTQFIFDSSTGNLGLGTSTPFATFAIQATTTQTTPLFEIASTSNATKFLSVSSTGFGTTTLSGLTISGSATSTSNVGLSLTSGCFAIGSNCLSLSTISGTLGIASGGTGTTTAPVGQLLYGGSSAYQSVATSSPIAGTAISLSGTGALVGSALTINFAAPAGTGLSIPFASTTMVSATTASTTNLWISGIASGSLLKTTTGGQVTNAVAGTDYAAASSVFGKAWEVSGSFLAPTTTLYVTNIQQASSTVFSANQAQFGGTATSTFTAAGFLGIGSSTPWGLLSVNPNNLAAGVPQFVVGSSSQTSFVIAGNGNVGVGTSTPFAKFSLFTASTTFTGPTLFNISSSTSAFATSTLFTIDNTGKITGLAFSFGGGTTTALTTGNLLATGSSTLQNFTFQNATGTSATTTLFAVSSIASGSLVKTTTGGSLVAAVAGTDYQTFGYLFPSNATNTLLAFNGGLTTTNASATSLFSSTILGSVAKFGATASSSFAADGALTLAGSLNGPLQANNGLVSATTSIGVLYGGTGSTTLTGLLKGNGLGSVQTAVGGTDYEFPLTFNSGLTRSTNTVTLNTANANTWTALQQFAAGASSTQFSTLDYLAVGRIATTTIRGDGIASTIPFASTTMITATTASSTNLIASSLGAAACDVKANNGVLSCGTDVTGLLSYDAFTHPFADSSATTSLMILTGGASTTIASIFDRLYVGGTATTTIRGDGVASTIPFASTTMISATTASSTNLFVSGISNSLLKTVNGQVGAAVLGADYQNFGYLFPSNATTTLLAFNGGLTTTNATATNLFSSTILGSVAKFGATASSSFDTTGALTLSSALAYTSGGTGTSTAAKWGDLLVFTGSNYQGFATSSLGLLTTNVAE